MGCFLDNWGSFASLVGVIISAAGLAAALVAMQRAGKARDSAAAAELASRETSEAIAAVLLVVELQRAIALIQRIKVLIRDGLWLVSLEHYQPLRAMLSDIKGRFPISQSEYARILDDGIRQVTVMENSISSARASGGDPSVQGEPAEVLNNLQEDLEQIASSTYLIETRADD